MKKLIAYILSVALISSFVPLLANAATTPITKNVKSVKSKIVAINMTAKDFAFKPSVINAHQGDTVKVTLTGADNKHSFSLATFHVNTVVNRGQTKIFSFKVTKKGTFTFRCGVPCGPGHEDMKGTIIVS